MVIDVNYGALQGRWFNDLDSFVPSSDLDSIIVYFKCQLTLIELAVYFGTELLLNLLVQNFFYAYKF